MSAPEIISATFELPFGVPNPPPAPTMPPAAFKIPPATTSCHSRPIPSPPLGARYPGDRVLWKPLVFSMSVDTQDNGCDTNIEWVETSPELESCHISPNDGQSLKGAESEQNWDESHGVEEGVSRELSESDSTESGSDEVIVETAYQEQHECLASEQEDSAETTVIAEGVSDDSLRAMPPSPQVPLAGAIIKPDTVSAAALSDGVDNFPKKKIEYKQIMKSAASLRQRRPLPSTSHQTNYFNMISELNIGERDIKDLLPSFFDRQTLRDSAWQDALQRAGFASLTETLHTVDLDGRDGLSFSTELPPYFRIGNLRFAKKSTPEFSADRVKYLESMNYPALMMVRDKSAALHFSHLSHESIARFVQIYLMQLVCNLEPTVVKCTAIDLQNFGGSFGLLTAAFPSLELLTTRNEVDAFFEKLPEDVRRGNQSKGYRYPYLYQYNRIHRESALPYHFVVVSSFETDLSENHKELLKRLIANNNSAKVGLYFLILFQTESAFQEMHQSNTDLPAISEILAADNSSKIELFDPAGLNTSKSGRQEHLTITPDVTNERDIDRIVTYCLKHLNKNES